VAGPRDLDVVGQLRLDFLSELRRIESQTLAPAFRAATARFFETGQAQGTVRSWLAERAGTAVGVVSVIVQAVAPHPEDDRTLEGLIVNMYVRPAVRGQGVGRRLLEACLAAGPDLGLRRFNLYATAAGRPMYAEAGFVGRDDWMVLGVPPAA
jgi:GNAT superfamily N-acetyltransferase